MNRQDIDWPYIKIAGLWFIACTVVTSSLWYASHQYMTTHYGTLQKTRHDNRNLRRQISQAKRDAVTILKYKDSYTRLLQQGLIGQEHRLSWISRLRAVASRLKIKSARFRLTAQTRVPPGLVNTGGLLELGKSRMKLSLDLAHEQDLLRVFAALRKEPGYFSVNRCTIKRNSARIVIAASASNLAVQCDLDWYSLNRPGSTGENHE